MNFYKQMVDVCQALVGQRYVRGWLALVTLGWVWAIATALPLGHHHHHDQITPCWTTLVSWLVMTVAMMGLSISPAISHVAVNSLAWRRGRAIIMFTLGYLGAWALVGTAALLLPAVLPGPEVALLLAALWQITHVKRHYLRECHRSWPLPVTGLRAEHGALRFGLHNGGACLGSCWLIMLAAITVPANHLAWMAAAIVLITAEKVAPRPRRLLRNSALVLAVAGIVAFYDPTAALLAALATSLLLIARHRSATFMA